ncbi:MAG: zf-TFIIB domain-containing protein [Candidatus Heimdallarchaeota archaeon]|nr:MAG: zf-TFIIB domain-containing protein [Candidatus Heimdallarchaeota archaeon]
MGPNMKGQTCPECRTPIEKLAFGGGHVYLCPKCQIPP